MIFNSNSNKVHQVEYEVAASSTTISDSVEDLVLSLSLYDLVKIGAEPRDKVIPPCPRASECKRCEASAKIVGSMVAVLENCMVMDFVRAI